MANEDKPMDLIDEKIDPNVKQPFLFVKINILKKYS
jgi:hypothetical protein